MKQKFILLGSSDVQSLKKYLNFDLVEVMVDTFDENHTLTRIAKLDE